MRTALFLVACVAMPAMAQHPDVSGSRQSDARKAWFVQAGIPEGFENPVKVMTGRNVELLTLSNRLASGPVKIPPDGIISLVREVPDPKDPNKIAYLTLAKASIPESMNQALIVLVPLNKKPESDLVFNASVQGLANFKGGDCFYINLTDKSMGIEAGEGKFVLKPKTSKIHNAPVTEKLGTTPYRYSYYDPDKKKWKVLSASIDIISSSRREIRIFSMDEHNGRVRCRGVTFPVM